MLGRQAMLGQEPLWRRSITTDRFPSAPCDHATNLPLTTAKHSDVMFLELRHVDDLYEEAPNRTRYGNALLMLYFAAMISSSTRNSGLNSCGIMRNMEAG